MGTGPLFDSVVQVLLEELPRRMGCGPRKGNASRAIPEMVTFVTGKEARLHRLLLFFNKFLHESNVVLTVR